ncbi:peptidase C60 sortase A and B [Kribbella flavida DSM 17836]|uniref:Peptidase C60 sortase A and B n=1 Tax=Kribbella flavida (strain DSM 17836 / JCM 10339 / NBRC 14399) TaxID=479435 RepID=D2PWL0_KRIFD|nr:class F sortase [Kribbella flavida]ADB33479.1 peptidase C60 sortase A and B [Kribbella flavida DSM 17836]
MNTPLSPLHTARALAVVLMVLVLGGCGGPGASSSSTASGDGRVQGASPAAGGSPTPGPAAPSPVPSPPAPGTAVRTRAAELPRATVVPAPERLTIRSVGLDLPVRAVGVAADGQMELPVNPSVVGWYRFGPAPAEREGSVVLGGHVDSKEYGVGPLVRLRKLRPGALIDVRATDGSTVQYRVEGVRDVEKQELAVGELFGRTGPRRLHLVTCGGPYDPDGGGYRDNLVVTATTP